MENKLWKRYVAGLLAGTLFFSQVGIDLGSIQAAAAEPGTISPESPVSPEVPPEEEVDISLEGYRVEALFQDENLIAYLKETVDLNENGRLSPVEISNVRGLNLSGLGIKNLEGIEIFQNLELLQCDNNKLGKLDLTSNKKLNKLYCNSNQLVSLTLDKNVELQELDCSDNMLGELQIQNCGKLSVLNCRNNLLSELNVEYSSQLLSLDCGNNELLSKLNVSSNAKLKELICDGCGLNTLLVAGSNSLETLNCEDNYLESLNVKTNKSLKKLLCSYNNLQELDLSSLEKLQEIACSDNQIPELSLQKCTALLSLDCRNNRIQNLDLSSNKQLTTLTCSNNQLLYIDISDNSQLTTFICENNERTIDLPILDLEQLGGIEEEKISELSNATLEEGKFRYVNTSLPITYKYQVNQEETVTFTLHTTGVFKSMATVNLEKIGTRIYQGEEIKPALTAFYGSQMLEENKDYTVTYRNNINAGTATVTLRGKGEYDGTVTQTFQIEPMDIAQTDIADIPNQVYSGQAITPQISISFGETALDFGTDYNVNYSDNYSIGQAKVEIIGNGNFKGSVTTYFDIEAKHIGRAAVRSIDNQVYNGLPITPEVIIEDGANRLVEGTDYTFSYADNVNAGTAKIHIMGMGNYGKESQETFIIEPKAINNLWVEEIPDTNYNGYEKRPAVSVYDEEIQTALIENEDYVLEYENNTQAGTATVFIKGIGNYKGQIEKEFQIVVRSADHVQVETIAAQEYTGTEIKPELIVKDGTERLQQGRDYTLKYTNNVAVGSATIEMEFKGNYTGIITTSFQIKPRELSHVDFSKVEAQYYTGDKITPEVSLSHGNTVLVKDTDYQVIYEENTAIGKGKILFYGLGNYCGNQVMEFDITPRPVELTKISCDDSYIYTGEAFEPKPMIVLNGYQLIEHRDYELTYHNNINAGNGEVTITGIGNFCGESKLSFQIQPKAMENWQIEELGPRIYTGQEIIPEVIAWDEEKEMIQGKDFTIALVDNTAVGTATLLLTARGNYYGERELTFEIAPKDIKWVQIQEILPQTYNGKQQKPEISVTDQEQKLVENLDYTVTYGTNVAKGTGEVTITGLGNYTGTQRAVFEIQGASMTHAKLFIKSQVTYTGRAVSPTVTVYYGGRKLTVNKDYVVFYYRNKAVGTAMAVVEGIGNYKDTKAITYKIMPRKAVISKLSLKKGVVTVKWSRRTEASGYYVEYTQDKTFTNNIKRKNIKSGKTLTVSIKNLEKKKRYYFRVRSYKTVNGKKVYGAYSKVKSIKVK